MLESIYSRRDLFHDLKRKINIEFQSCCSRLFATVTQLDADDDPINAWYMLAAMHYIIQCLLDLNNVANLIALLEIFATLAENVCYLLEEENESYLRYFISFYDKFDSVNDELVHFK